MSKEIFDVNLSEFFENLKAEGDLIQEQVMGSNEDGDSKVFYYFEDAVDESEEEGYELDQFGEAYYFYEEKIYEVSIDITSGQPSSLSELDQKEIEQLIKKLIADEPYEGNTETFYEENSWAQNFRN